MKRGNLKGNSEYSKIIGIKFLLLKKAGRKDFPALLLIIKKRKDKKNDNTSGLRMGMYLILRGIPRGKMRPLTSKGEYICLQLQQYQQRQELVE